MKLDGVRVALFDRLRRAARPLVRLYVRSPSWLPGRPWLARRVLLPSLRRQPVTFRARARWGGVFRGRTEDVIQRYLYALGVWEPNVTRLMQDHLRAGDIVIDVGANIGYHAVLSARLVGPSGHVLAVEPSPTIRAQLIENVHANDVAGIVEIVPVAVSDSPGELRLVPGPATNVGLATVVHSDEPDAGHVVRADTLDNIVDGAGLDPQRVRLLKVDVEGAEVNVLRGARRVLSTLPFGALVVVEVEPSRLAAAGGSVVEAVQLMVGLGYRPHRIDNDYDVERVARDPAGSGRLEPLGELDTIVEETEMVFRRVAPADPAPVRVLHDALEDRSLDLSVIVPARNEAATIGLQLEALAVQRGDAVFEVVVGDNGSTDATVAAVEAFAGRFDRLVVVDASARPGCGAAKNQAAAHARAPLLAFCDADDIVAEGWVAAVASGLSDADFVAGPSVTFTEEPRHDATHPSAPTTVLGFLPFAEGCNLGIHAGVFLDAGGFDEGALAAEDVELSWRLQLDGLRLGWASAALVHKRDRRDGRGLIRQFARYGSSEAWLYRRFRPDGVPPPTPMTAARRWASVFVRAPLALAGRGRRAWCVDVGKRLGRLVGSIREGVWYP